MDDALIPTEKQMLDEVLDGLQQPQKWLPSKFFYDRRGSELFEEITTLDEYYLTRSEIEILEHHIHDIVQQIGSRAVILELGSGSSKKTRMLLDHLEDAAAYIPVDISDEYLMQVVKSLKREYPHLAIQPVCADYTKSFSLPEIGQEYDRCVAFYPGSTIGNFRPGEAKKFLGQVASITGPSGALLVGIDLKKDKKILEAAYNDKKGVTAAFNKNILRRLNREIGADFDLDLFTHHAFYNEEKGRIEMHLRCESDHSVQIDGEVIRFSEGETIHTESSYKYSLEGFEKLASDWYTVEKVWTDRKNLFSLQFLNVK